MGRLLLTTGHVEPAAGALEVVCLILQCHLRPRFRCRNCFARGRELWVRGVAVIVVEVKGEEVVADRHVLAAPALAYGRAVKGQGCVACGHCNGARMVRHFRRVMTSKVVPEVVCEWPEGGGVAGSRGAAGVAGCARCRGLRFP